MKNKSNNFAYIDGANLYRGVESLGWKLDYRRFGVWLSEKYGVKSTYLFIGLIPKYKELYKYLQEAGFTLVFKEVVYDGDGKPKGNCDAWSCPKKKKPPMRTEPHRGLFRSDIAIISNPQTMSTPLEILCG